jgi:RNA polymerase sigma-70 factor (ECF subfamily)
MSWKTSPKKFEEIYEENHRFIRTVVYWILRDDSVEDVVQEVFIRAWKSRDTFKGKSNIRTWLYRIARNCCYDQFQKKHPDTNGEEVEDIIDQATEDIALKEVIDLAISQMSLEQRESFVLFYKLGMTQKEIAQLREIPEGTVKSQLFSARNIFTKVMEKEGVTCEG